MIAAGVSVVTAQGYEEQHRYTQATCVGAVSADSTCERNHSNEFANGHLVQFHILDTLGKRTTYHVVSLMKLEVYIRLCIAGQGTLSVRRIEILGIQGKRDASNQLFIGPGRNSYLSA